MPYKHNRYQPCFEYMFVFSKGKPKSFNPLIENCKGAGTPSRIKRREIDGELVDGCGKGKLKNDTMYRRNIWAYGVGFGVTTTDKVAFGHPAIFPEKLAEDHILSWSNPNDVILDPFAGSGTTLKMAKLNNRNYIGFEVSNEYCDIIEQRLTMPLLDTNGQQSVTQEVLDV